MLRCEIETFNGFFFFFLFTPQNVDPKSVTSTMNSQGVLCIKASKLAIEAPKETTIPVEFKS